jgi:hypothetical protein
MKFQLVEAFKGGHHTNYIEALLPALRMCLKESILSEVVINVSKSHYELLVQSGVVVKESNNLIITPTFPEFNPNPSLKERYQLFKALSVLVQKENADAVVCTSADYDIMYNALLTNFLPHANKLGIIHYGYPEDADLSFKEKIKQKIYRLSWKYSKWDKLLLVNPVVFECIRNQDSHILNKMHLLPDPVQFGENVDVLEARNRLGIPVDGNYIGFVGMMDHRKAIPELLFGYVNSGAYKTTRLLLAGRLNEDFTKLIESEYQNYVDNQRIILINRHLTSDEIQWGYMAIDVHALLQYRRMNLSANLLKAAVNKKMIIVDNCGYTGMMVRRFNLGFTCNVNNHDSVSETLLKALEFLPNFIASDSINRLAEFHSPDNYAYTIINEAMKAKLLPTRSWDWVCEGASG